MATVAGYSWKNSFELIITFTLQMKTLCIVGIGQTRSLLGAIGAKNRRAYAYFAGAPIAPIAFQY